MEDMSITPRTITELKQITPAQVTAIAEEVLAAERTMTQSKDALEDLSASLNNFAYAKAEYDEVAGKVKRQMRELIPHI